MSVLTLLRPRLDLSVSREAFVFSISPAEQVRIAPVVRMEPNGYLLDVGEEARSMRQGELVEFFADTSAQARFGVWALEPFFEKFCRFGIKLVYSHSLFTPRPEVSITGADSLQPILLDWTRPILQRSLLAGGARAVRFDERPLIS